MSRITASLFNGEEGSNITVVIPGKGSFPATDAHPRWKDILQKVVVEQSQDADLIVGLFDVSQLAGHKFERLSERVTVSSGEVRFDGDPVDNSLTKQILRFVTEEEGDWAPLVLFMEKVMTNPEEHSRQQLFDWINRQDVSITTDGDMIAYKGVESNGKGGYQSTATGRAQVDGVVYKGKIPNYVGAVVEMPRSEVHHDPNTSCSTGLHVGSFKYAEEYSRGGCMLEVLVNPRDVKSVPRDGKGEKARTCRYRVHKIVTEPRKGLVIDVEAEKRAEAEAKAREAREVAAREAREAADQAEKAAYEAEKQAAIDHLEKVRAEKAEEVRVDPLFKTFVLEDNIEATPTNQTGVTLPSTSWLGTVNVTQHPSEGDFDTMVRRAARRRRNFLKYAEKHGPWKFLGGDDHFDRFNWKVQE